MSELEVIVTRDGHRVVRDAEHDELMHPFGPRLEAESLYVGPAHIATRLADGPLTVFDAGLGAGTNAIAAWRAARGQTGLRLVSFDLTLDALALVLREAPADFGFEDDADRAAAKALVDHHSYEDPRGAWRFVRGDLPRTLTTPGAQADVVFWDPYAPQANPNLWNVAAFTALRAVCAARATVHTYAAGTSVRAAMILAGFAVGRGPSIGTKSETTIAAIDPADLEAPLDRRWYERWRRSSNPLPPDAPTDANDRIHAAFER